MTTVIVVTRETLSKNLEKTLVNWNSGNNQDNKITALKIPWAIQKSPEDSRRPCCHSNFIDGQLLIASMKNSY